MVAWKFDGGAPKAEVAAEKRLGKCSVAQSRPGGASSATSALGRWGVIRERQAPELGCHFYRILARKMRGIHHGEGVDSMWAWVCVSVRLCDHMFPSSRHIHLAQSWFPWIGEGLGFVSRNITLHNILRNVSAMSWNPNIHLLRAFYNQNRQVTRGCHYPLTPKFPLQLNIGQNKAHNTLTVDCNCLLVTVLSLRYNWNSLPNSRWLCHPEAPIEMVWSYRKTSWPDPIKSHIMCLAGVPCGGYWMHILCTDSQELKWLWWPV